MPSRIGYINLTLLCLFLSFGAQLIGFCIPGWLHIMVYSYDSTNVNMVSLNFALWYAVICWNGMCRTKSYNQLKADQMDVSDDKYGFHHVQDFDDYDFTARHSRFPFSRLLEFQIEAACALVVALMSLLLMRKQKKRLLLYMSGKREKEPNQSTYCMVFCYAVISGALVLVPASTFIDINEDLSIVTNNYKIGMPYAMICSGSGGVLALLSCLFLVGTMCKSVVTSDIYNSDSNGEGANESANAGHQLVPLVQVDNPTSGRGYADPVEPGYEPAFGNITCTAVVTISNSGAVNESRARSDRARGERLENSGSALDSYNSGINQDFEQPPPSYEECIKQYGKAP